MPCSAGTTTAPTFKQNCQSSRPRWATSRSRRRRTTSPSSSRSPRRPVVDSSGTVARSSARGARSYEITTDFACLCAPRVLRRPSASGPWREPAYGLQLSRRIHAPAALSRRASRAPRRETRLQGRLSEGGDCVPPPSGKPARQRPVDAERAPCRDPFLRAIRRDNPPGALGPLPADHGGPVQAWTPAPRRIPRVRRGRGHSRRAAADDARRTARQLSQGLYHVSRIARDLPDQLRRARIALGHGDRDALLVDVKTYESYLFPGPASCCGSAPPLCSCSVTRAFRRVGPPSCLVATKERRDRPLGHVVLAIKGADDPRLLDRRESAPGMQLAHLYGGLDGAELRDDGAKIAKAKPSRGASPLEAIEDLDGAVSLERAHGRELAVVFQRRAHRGQRGGVGQAKARQALAEI